MALKLNPKQMKGLETLCDPSKTRILFDGGSRSGKTMLITEYLLMRVFQFPGSRQLIARKNRVHALQSIWNGTLNEYLLRNIPAVAYRKKETELKISFMNGSILNIGGLDDAERVEKILGNEYISVFLNEATQLSWQTVQMVLTRLAQKVYDNDGGLAVPKLIMDCNPRGPSHWLHMAGVRHLDPETGKALPDAERWARINWSAYDNLENLPAEYIKSLEALPSVMKDRMLNGIWRSPEGAVYDEFDESLHLVKPFTVPEDWQRIRSIDFGYTNPFVCLWGAIDNDGRLYIYREHYRAKMRVAEHAQTINRLSEKEKILYSVSDHDASGRAELENAGIYTVKAEKDVQGGIQAVKDYLCVQEDGSPRLFLFDDLKNTVSEMYDYKWAPVSDSGSAREEPLKEKDHAMDALRYMVMSLKKPAGKFRIASKSLIDGRWK